MTLWSGAHGVACSPAWPGNLVGGKFSGPISQISSPIRSSGPGNLCFNVLQRFWCILKAESHCSSTSTCVLEEETNREDGADVLLLLGEKQQNHVRTLFFPDHLSQRLLGPGPQSLPALLLLWGVTCQQCHLHFFTPSLPHPLRPLLLTLEIPCLLKHRLEPLVCAPLTHGGA